MQNGEVMGKILQSPVVSKDEGLVRFQRTLPLNGEPQVMWRIKSLVSP